MMDVYSEAKYRVPDQKGDLLSQQIDEVNADEWICNETMNRVKEHIAIDQLFDEMGLSFTEEQQKQIDDSFTYQWGMLQKIYELNGVGETCLLYTSYLRLLSEAVGEQRGEAPPKTSAECMVDIRIGAHIPEEYISNLSQRIDIYKKIAAIQNKEDSMDVLDELIDRFGDPPQAVKGLVDVALVRNTAAGLGIKEISERGDAVWLIPEQLDMERVDVYKRQVPMSIGCNSMMAVL